MSNENYNPENDEYLNKLVKFKNKREELAQINNVVDKLNEELPPKVIRKMKLPWNWKLISGLILSLAASVALIFIIPSIIDSQSKGKGDTVKVKTSVVAKDTVNFSFYILNNVGKEKHFNLSYEQYNKLKDMMPDSAVYSATYITQNGKSTITFENKDSLISRLNVEIKSGGDMDFENFLIFIKTLQELCDRNINSSAFVFGNFPKIKNTFGYELFDFQNMCLNLNIFYFENASSTFSEEQTLIINHMKDSFKINTRIIK